MEVRNALDEFRNKFRLNGKMCWSVRLDLLVSISSYTPAVGGGQTHMMREISIHDNHKVARAEIESMDICSPDRL